MIACLSVCIYICLHICTRMYLYICIVYLHTYIVVYIRICTCLTIYTYIHRNTQKERDRDRDVLSLILPHSLPPFLPSSLPHSLIHAGCTQRPANLETWCAFNNFAETFPQSHLKTRIANTHSTPSAGQYVWYHLRQRKGESHDGTSQKVVRADILGIWAQRPYYAGLLGFSKGVLGFRIQGLRISGFGV